MPTSGTETFTLQRDELISCAFNLINVEDPEGNNVTQSMIDHAAKELNIMVKAWAVEGMPVFKVQTTRDVTINQGQAEYTMGPTGDIVGKQPLRVESVRLVEQLDGNIIELRQLSRNEYETLPAGQEGMPTGWYFKKDTTGGSLFLYQTPDLDAATDYLFDVLYAATYEDFTAGTDEPDFPQHFYQALEYSLAHKLSITYGKSPQLRQELYALGREEKERAFDFSAETASVYFQVDTRYTHRGY